MQKYIMTLDQGTTSSRCIIFDRQSNIVASKQYEFTQIYPKAGWVEHNPEEIWQSQIKAAKDALEESNLTYKDMAAVGITNQRETVILWDKITGKPIYNAIVWQCRRTSDMCSALKSEGYEKLIKNKTGLVIDPYFSATKLKWLLDNVKGENLMFGTVDTWLIWKLSGGKLHITDYTNASRTMLFNINTLEWDDELLSIFGIPKSILPEVKPSCCFYGMTDASIFGGEIPLSGIAGDQQAALFGQTCFELGDVKNTYGTGCFMLMNTGKAPIFSENGLLTTIACAADGSDAYALEGSVFVAGAAVQWLRDELKLIKTAAESEKCALLVEDTNGVYTVPAFTGLGAPYWNSYARGIITGLTRGVNRNHIVRSILESIAYQTYDLLGVMENDSGIKMRTLKVDGGACANNFLMQFQSDISGVNVERPSCIETTALGASYLAGLAVGYYKNTDDIISNRKIERIFTPDMSIDKQKILVDGWHNAINKIK